MKIKRKSKNKKRAIILSVVLVLVFSSGAFAWFSQSQQNNNDKSATKTDAKKEDASGPSQQSDQEKSEAQDEAGQNEKTIRPNIANADTGNTPEKPNITRAEQSGEFIRVSALLSKPSNGKCVLKLEKSGSKTITKEAFVIVGPSYYTCNGFRVPKNELGTTGAWSVTITHQANGKSSTSERKEINVY